MTEERRRDAERTRGRESAKKRRREARRDEEHEAGPLHADEQEAPAEERPTTPDEDAGQDVEELERPPQAEGPRKEE